MNVTVPGEPVAKARPRVTTRGTDPVTGRLRSHTYTPATTVAYETRIRAAWLAAAGRVGTDSSARYAVHLVFRTGNRRRVDLDNLCKAALDGLQGAAFPDDAQVWALSAVRVIVAPGHASTEVTVRRIDDEEAAA